MARHLPSAGTRAACKSLGHAERAFHNLKPISLQIRPTHSWTAKRVRAQYGKRRYVPPPVRLQEPPSRADKGNGTLGRGVPRRDAPRPDPDTRTRPDPARRLRIARRMTSAALASILTVATLAALALGALLALAATAIPVIRAGAIARQRRANRTLLQLWGQPLFARRARRLGASGERFVLRRLRTGDGRAWEAFYAMRLGERHRRRARSIWPSARAQAAVDMAALPPGAVDRELLARLINDRDPVVREAAIRSAASRCGAEIADALLASLVRYGPGLYRVARYTLGRSSAPILPVLERYLASPAPYVVRLCVDVLGDRGEAGALPLLLPRAAHPDKEIRLRVARAMRKLAGPEAERALRHLLGDPAWEVRAQAATAAGAHAGALAAQLEVAARDRNPWVRANAERSLRRRPAGVAG